jgi:GNAT superfamily N-acetyltransferase
MQPGQETQVCELVTRVFDEFVAPDFPPEGIREFLSYVQPEALRERSRAGYLTLVAWLDDEMVGVVQMKNHSHVSLYFVEGAHMGKGIGRELWRRALAISRRQRPDLVEITVNASLYAVPIYQKLGFRQTKPEQVVNGIRVVPMAVGVGSDEWMAGRVGLRGSGDRGSGDQDSGN